MADRPNVDNGQVIDLLGSIDSTLKQIYREGSRMSQSDLRNAMPGRQFNTGYSNGDRWRTNRRQKSGLSGGGLKSDGTEFKGVLDEFEDGLREALMESLGTSNFRENIAKHLSSFEKEFGVNLKDVPVALGKDLGKQLINWGKNTEMGKWAKQKVTTAKERAGSYVKGKAVDFAKGVYSHNKEDGRRVVEYMQRTKKASPADAASMKDAAQQSVQVQSGADTAFVESNSAKGESSIEIAQYDLLTAIATNVEIIAQFAEHQLKNAEAKQNQMAAEAAKQGQDIKFADDLRGKERPGVQSMKDLKEQAATKVQDMVKQNGGELPDFKNMNLDSIVAGIKNVGTSMLGDLGKKFPALSKVTSKAISGLAKLGPKGLIAAAAIAVVAYGLSKQLGPAIEGTKELFNGMRKAGNRYQESRKKNLDYEKDRLEADVKTMVETPFKILEDAAQAWYDAWDNQLRTINGTQGYTKDDLYSLMGSYADRLRDDGLTSVISSADITSNLAKVLESGLTGKVAEEFAYIATLLNSAVPTQDFFGYGETYASIATNAMNAGMSQAEAISYANEQLELFASNVLYASRQISGGFSSGLKDAQSLFESATKIAVTSRTGEVSHISGVLTSISAMVGAIAPDLSSSIVETVVNAAIGGNSNEYVALRSLAGVNASNTEFLRLLAQNPQQLFTQVFEGLAELQHMSDANYMEVAEGLSETFGVPMEALARVDFNYLAQAISEMNVNNASLTENMKLLSSGETTTTSEQLKMQQINEYMLEEGLTYVLDNQAARSIQEHMWDEQIARELMEATYAVDLQGSALKFLEGISQTVENIINFLNPFSFLKKVVNLVATAQEGKAQRSDIRQLLELGKVGPGNARDLYNLTTTNANLNLTDSLVGMMGGFSTYDAIHSALSGFNALTTFTGRSDIRRNGKSALRSIVQSSLSEALSGYTGDIKSSYTWGRVGKSTVKMLSDVDFGSSLITGLADVASGAVTAAVRTQSRFQEFLDSMSRFVENNQSYDEWRASASRYGIKDVDTAIEEYGLTEAQLQGQFQAQEAKKASEHQHERELIEDTFWAQGVKFWTETHPEWSLKMYGYQETQITKLGDIATAVGDLYTLNNTFFNTDFKDWWKAEFLDHANYNPGISLSEVKDIQDAEKSGTGDAILALAEALTANSVNYTDPVAQTNALLAKILLVAEAIMQQNNQGGGALATTLAGLSIGLTTKA